jgi:hypothetical protein
MSLCMLYAVFHLLVMLEENANTFDSDKEKRT